MEAGRRRSHLAARGSPPRERARAGTGATAAARRRAGAATTRRRPSAARRSSASRARPRGRIDGGEAAATSRRRRGGGRDDAAARSRRRSRRSRDDAAATSRRGRGGGRDDTAARSRRDPTPRRDQDLHRLDMLSRVYGCRQNQLREPLHIRRRRRPRRVVLLDTHGRQRLRVPGPRRERLHVPFGL